MDRPRRSPESSTPLSSTSLEVTITDLVAEFVILHRFQNTGKQPIEAVFSFPIPLDAAFLGMSATLAGETLVAEIQPERQASRTYDDAIAGGHSAVLLRNPEPGVLCTSLGNLMPGETGDIELRFVTPLRVADRTARFSLPLVHRPRYGSWHLEDLERPTHDFAVQHPMSAMIRVVGLLATSPVACATHAARFALRDGTLELSIPEAMLDRDLVLTFELSQALPPVTRLIPDGETALGLASFVLPDSNEAPKALDLCLVLDGSGSMAGDAIEQSRRAASAIIDALGDDDRIQVLRFGSTIAPMFRRPLLATARVRDALRELVPTIDSNLGGTEMGNALEKALDQLSGAETDRSRAIVLVTDGAVQPSDVREAKAAALEAGVRIFVVAVGSSAGAEVLGPMAEATGAILERAVPAEPIDAGVMRQFRRARETGAVALDFEWPGSGAVPIPMGIAYPGDAVNLAACLPALTDGELIVRAPSLGFSIRLPLRSCVAAPALRALVGQQRYRSASDSKRESMALQYGLLTEETSAVLVKLRVDGTQADGLPTIIQVPQMVSEGMVGSSIDAMKVHSASMPRYSMASSAPLGDVMACMDMSSHGDADMDIPAFLRRQEDPDSDIAFSRRVSKATEPSIVIPADRAHEIFLLLHMILLQSWLASRPKLATLAGAVGHLPDDMRDQALCLLRKCGLSIDDTSASVRLLFSLDTILPISALTDEDEAMFALAIDDSETGTADLARVFGNGDVKLGIAIATSLRKETSVPVGRTLGNLFQRFRRPPSGR